jgi:hypothetical protein
MPETPSFVWDRDLPPDRLRAALADSEHADHDRLLALLLREARPDEVWRWTNPEHVAVHLDRLAPRLGRKRAFWVWLFDGWRRLGLLD